MSAFTAAVVINFGCDQAVVAWNKAFHDVDATAATKLDVNCEWDFTGEDGVPIAQPWCLNDLARPCCKVDQEQVCYDEGYLFDGNSKQLY